MTENMNVVDFITDKILYNVTRFSKVLSSEMDQAESRLIR